MQLKKYRWSRDYESAEEELHQILYTKYPDAKRWEAAEYTDFPAHAHSYDKKLWCAEGSILFKLENGTRISLQPGDALDLPASTVHEAQAGISGCVCYELQLLP